MKMNQSLFFKNMVLLIMLSLGSISAFPESSAGNQQPNILIIMADDATYNDLPLYGGNNVKTPNIDRLATEGLTFNKAFLSMSMCVPCRAALYTGLYPVKTGVCWNHAPARTGIRSIVHYLGDLGYRCGIAGKVHAEPNSVYPFEMVEGIERNCVSETANYDDRQLGEFIMRDEKQPFCLVAALVVPHIPWTVGDPSHFDPEKLMLPPYLAETKDTREQYARYLAEIEVLDQQVGSLLKMLDGSGQAENTMVIFTSEQGAQLPFCKWTNWNTGVHTAFIVRWPGTTQAGKRTDALIQYVDVLPTLIEAAGGTVKLNEFDGSSFMPVLHGLTDYHRDYAYFMHNNIPEGPPYPIRSVSDGKYHYIRNLQPESLYIEKHLFAQMPLNEYWNSWTYESWKNEHAYAMVQRYMKRPPEELYRLDLDPNEMKNLAPDPAHKATLDHLSEQLDQWMKSQGDPGAAIDSKEVWQAANEFQHFDPIKP
jgi:uncharacterized sulfatase